MDNAKTPNQFKDHTANAEVVWHESSVTKTMRGLAKAQKPVCIWLTGLSGSGKSTIANALEQHLHREGFHTMLLDGDNVRHGLCRDLSMSASDRTENIRRVDEVAKLMTDAGLIVITAFISPFRADRKIARDMFAQGEFIEVFINTPLEVCKLRDPKGLYEKALKGDIRDFTGISSPYEPPITPEIDLNCGSCSAAASLHELFLQLTPYIKHQNS